MKLFATTSLGLEPALEEELRALGAKEIEPRPGGVSFEGSLETLYRACLELRTAIRVLRPLREFSASTPEMLYDQVRRIPWETILTLDTTFAIDAAIAKRTPIDPTEPPGMTHSKYAALKIKDAIADRMRKEMAGERPNVDTENPHIPIRAHFSGTRCTLSLDACGDSLHLRGYRKEGVAAPLQETLAAGLLLHAGWDPSGCLFDPMCGSGTIPIEAALLASNTAPGLLRASPFPFSRWPDYDEALWTRLVREARSRVKPAPPRAPIHGWDVSGKAIAAATANAERAGMRNWIRFEERDANPLTPPEGEAGLLLVNPPYGERLKVHDLEGMYKALGDSLKKNFPGWKAGILTGNLEAAKRIGLKPTRRIPLRNGPIECRLFLYELYEGSRHS